MFVDNVTITIKAGNGGNGASTFLRNGLTHKGGPDGGNGGNGGSIYFQGSNNIRDLKQFQFKKKVNAEDGVPGKNRKLFGKNADHTIVSVPIGTRIVEIESGREVEILDTTTQVLLARGGIGGRGNTEFKSATNQAPTYAEAGTRGEFKTLHLELRLIAEIGLIGLPNAGKSSLLAVLTNADPRIGAYPFTTLEPNIGMIETHAIADIPGLIEGAAEGKGLGVKFLKHIEKTKILVHCIALDDEHPEETYKIVRNEFREYNAALLEKPEIILLTKSDLVDEKTIEKKIKLFKKTHKTVLTTSVYDEESLKKLKEKLVTMLETSAQKSQ